MWKVTHFLNFQVRIMKSSVHSLEIHIHPELLVQCQSEGGPQENSLDTNKIFLFNHGMGKEDLEGVLANT